MDHFSLPVTDPVLIFALVMLIILVAPIMFSRLRIPGLVGLILAGIVVGPNGLHLLERDETIQLLGTVGLLYIMFSAGLEIDLNRFIKYRRHSIVFGSLTFFVPQILGTVMAIYLLGFSWAPAILLASMFASHTLIAYPIVSRLGISKNNAVTTAVGGTIITDTAALLVLAIIIGSTEGVLDAPFWLRLIGGLGIFTFLLFWGLPRVGRWFFRYVSKDGSTEFVFVLASVFLAAFGSEVAGVEPIIGAFLAGLALNRLIPEHGPLMSRINFVGDSLFIPFFLISVGMLVDLRVLLTDSDSWLIAGSMTGTVLLTKWAAARVSQVLLGYSSEEGNVIFGLSVAQAAATLAVVLIAYETFIGDTRLFDESVLNGAILMILVTCIIAPWITEKYGRVVASKESARPYDPSEAPQRILIPLANPATADHLMDMAFMIRASEAGEALYPLTVARDGDDVQAQVAYGEKLLSHAVLRAAATDVPVTPLTRVDMNIANGIMRAIKERRISQVVIGWNGEVTTRQRIFGTVLDRLLEHSRELVMVCKVDHSLNTTERVYLAIPPLADREAGFVEALGVVKTLVNQIGGQLRIVCAKESEEAIMEVVNTTSPETPAEVVALEGWIQLLPMLEAKIGEDDLLILMSAREGTIAWRPGLNRLPSMFSRRLKDANFAIVYPALRSPEDGDYGQIFSNRLVPGSLSMDRVEFDLKPGTDEEIVRQIISTEFFDKPELTDDLTPLLLENARDYDPEVGPGTILLHVHTPMVARQLLFLGLSKEGFAFPGAISPVRAAFVVLNPIDFPPEQHLETLTYIARLIRSEATLQRLLASQTVEELHDALSVDSPGD
jgi:Kef-type K+ transport system membrane component KefB/mannitol/fructose-specific phosphotransferase system IIA component (Ntr-type)